MALLGNEVLLVTGVAPNGQLSGQSFQTTTGAIAVLAGQDTSLIETGITTVGNGTLTAAGLIGGQIARTGPVAAFTDTLDTAANIVTALGAFTSGQTFIVRIKNATAFVQTLAIGTGITLPATVINSPFSVYNAFGTVGGTAASPTVTFTHMLSAPLADNILVTVPATTVLNTVGNGTITAAGIISGFTARGGAQSGAAFTDTTDTAANIIAAQPGLVNKIGTAFLYTYVNQTNASATITGGVGVTVSVLTVVPLNSWVQYLITYTAAGTLTMVGLTSGTNAESLPINNTNITTGGSGTLTAAAIVGQVITRSGPVAAYSDATDSAANIILAVPNAAVGVSFLLYVENTVPFLQTFTAGASVTLTENTVAVGNSVTIFLVKITSATTVSMQGIANIPLQINTIENITTLSTGGNGTILAAAIAGGIVTRTGAQNGTAFTDTVDNATNIIAAMPNANIGQSFELTYQNTTNAQATIANATGVTVSGTTVIPAGYTVRYLVTYTAASTITMVAFSIALATPAQGILAALSNTAATYVSSIALQQVPGLFVSLVTSGTYTFDCYLPVNTIAAAAGIAVAVSASNSLTATAFSASFAMANTTSVGYATATTSTIGNTMSSTTLCVLGRVTGSINVNTGGTLIITAAQAASSAQTTTIAAGGFLNVTRVS